MIAFIYQYETGVSFMLIFDTIVWILSFDVFILLDFKKGF